MCIFYHFGDANFSNVRPLCKITRLPYVDFPAAEHSRNFLCKNKLYRRNYVEFRYYNRKRQALVVAEVSDNCCGTVIMW